MSGRLGPYGRPNSFGRDTSGFKGWLGVNFYEGKNYDGSPRVSQGFKNILNNHEVHASEPPYPTGEVMAAHRPSDLYRQNYERIFGNKEATDAKR